MTNVRNNDFLTSPYQMTRWAFRVDETLVTVKLYLNQLYLYDLVCLSLFVATEMGLLYLVFQFVNYGWMYIIA